MDPRPCLQLLKQLSHELRDVDVGSSIDRVPIVSLTPMEFATQYVAKNKPVIITGAVDAWRAMQIWDEDYITARAGSSLVSVALTPTGRADAVTQIQPSSTDRADAVTQIQTSSTDRADAVTQIQTSSAGRSGATDQARSSSTCAPDAAPSSRGADDTVKWFMTPCEVKMDVATFFKLFRDSRRTQGHTCVVPYIQHQNSSLTGEWTFLQDDLQPALDWADQVFGGVSPDAVNFWLGDDRSVTSWHKDHYENMYAVIRGTKVFHLLPPSDLYRFNLRNYPSATFKLHSSTPSPPQAGHTHLSSPPDPAGKTMGSAQHITAALDTYSVYVDNQPLQLTLGASQLVPELDQPPQKVLWTEADINGPGKDSQSLSLFYDDTLPKPLIAEVGPGELLYLPACWYHRVSHICSQEEEGIDYVMAVNFWYDMAFDHRWAYFKLVEGLAVQLGLADSQAAA